MDRVSAFWSYLTSGSLFVYGMTLQEWYGFVGLVLAVATFGVNWFYKHRADLRAERLARVQLLAVAGEVEDGP